MVFSFFFVLRGLDFVVVLWRGEDAMLLLNLKSRVIGRGGKWEAGNWWIEDSECIWRCLMLYLITFLHFRPPFIFNSMWTRRFCFPSLSVCVDYVEKWVGGK